MCLVAIGTVGHVLQRYPVNSGIEEWTLQRKVCLSYSSIEVEYALTVPCRWQIAFPPTCPTTMALNSPPSRYLLPNLNPRSKTIPFHPLPQLRARRNSCNRTMLSSLPPPSPLLLHLHKHQLHIPKPTTPNSTSSIGSPSTSPANATLSIMPSNLPQSKRSLRSLTFSCRFSAPQIQLQAPKPEYLPHRARLGP